VKNALRIPIVILALVFAAVPVFAHHSWPTNNTRLVTVKGTVTEVMWQNPHPIFTIEVRSSSGQIEKWEIGGPAITRMEANGWTRSTIKVGDVVTGMGYQFADGQKIVRLEKVVLPNGKELNVYGR
jgi:hypothetical protein